MEKRRLALFLYLLVSSVLPIALAYRWLDSAPPPPPPAIFVFGDSTVDVGTNNYLKSSKAKANFPFNGIDFPGSIATGRFSNGFNVADYLAKFVGHPMSPPPFLALNKSKDISPMAKGANFASAGAGLYGNTGVVLWVEVVSMPKQVNEHFANLRQRLNKTLGSVRTSRLTSDALYLFNVGTNDIFEHYYFHRNESSSDQDAFIENLMSLYKEYLRQLYEVGARKFGIMSVCQIGCCPYIRTFVPHYQCLEPLNELSLKFYNGIDATMKELSLELKEMKYSLGDCNKIVQHISANPKIKELKAACCGEGELRGQKQCSPTSEYCKKRDQYLFWDSFHPTQYPSYLAAEILFNGPTEFVRPITFKQLAENGY